MDRIFEIYRKIVRGICKVFEIIAALSLVGMLVVVLIHVTLRYVFGNAPGWGEEMARQLMVIFCFICIAIGVRDNLHISLTIVVERLLKKWTLPIEVFNKFLTFCLGIMMSAFMGPYFTKLQGNRLPGTGIPVGFIYLFPTMIGILISLISLYQIYDYIKFGTDEDQKILAQEKEKE